MTTLVTLEVQSPGGNDSVSLVHARYCHYCLNLHLFINNFFKLAPEDLIIDLRYCGSSAQLVYTSRNIVPGQSRSFFYPFSNSIKIKLQVSGTRTFGVSCIRSHFFTVIGRQQSYHASICCIFGVIPIYSWIRSNFNLFSSCLVYE